MLALFYFLYLYYLAQCLVHSSILDYAVALALNYIKLTKHHSSKSNFPKLFRIHYVRMFCCRLFVIIFPRYFVMQVYFLCILKSALM